jgi:hypothetical protein
MSQVLPGQHDPPAHSAGKRYCHPAGRSSTLFGQRRSLAGVNQEDDTRFRNVAARPDPCHCASRPRPCTRSSGSYAVDDGPFELVGQPPAEACSEVREHRLVYDEPSEPEAVGEHVAQLPAVAAARVGTRGRSSKRPLRTCSIAVSHESPHGVSSRGSVRRISPTISWHKTELARHAAAGRRST